MMPWHVLSAVGELLNLAKINCIHFVTISLPWWYIFEIIASNICLYNNICEMLTRCESTCILAAAATYSKIKLELPI